MSQAYRPAQVALHWIVVALVVVQWATHDAMMRTQSSLLRPMPIHLFENAVHTWSGIAIGVLMLVRFVLRRRQDVQTGRNRHAGDVLARLVHRSLYLVLLAQTGTGIAAKYLRMGAAVFHVWLWKLLLALLVLHLLGAAWHLAARDGVAGRMLPFVGSFGRRRTEDPRMR